jgi:hypothetical protein
MDSRVLMGGFKEVGLSRGLLLYTMIPWKTPRKSMGEWDYRTRIILLLSSMKPVDKMFSNLHPAIRCLS